MNNLNNGTIMVVVATVITAIFIFMTDRVTPDLSKLENITSIEKNTDVQVASKVEEKPDVTPAAKDITTENTAEVDPVPVPETQAVMTEQKIVEEVLAPKGPFASSTNQTAKAEKAIPEVVFVKPSTFIATTEQHEVLDHIVQPIWMDQKLGDFKSIEESGVVITITPAGANGLQGENPEDVVTSKSDRFSSTMVPENYNYQQMPMYNGGYYIAPMPSYLMRSFLPRKVEANIQK